VPRRDEPLETTLQTSGRRLTGQRRLIVDLIREHGGHLDANELYRLARRHNPRLSLATIYRTLALLRDLGLVDEVHLGEEHHHYELKPVLEHGHMVCLGCGTVLEFSSSLLTRLKSEVEQAYAFTVTEAQVDLSGYCTACRPAQTTAP
jgi:Fur family transcriptional regulator, ferric uptake regulator